MKIHNPTGPDHTVKEHGDGKADAEKGPNQASGHDYTVLRAIEQVSDRALHEYEAHREQHRRESRRNRAIAIAAVVVTSIYTAVTVFLWLEQRRSTELAHRAWVLLDKIDRVDISPGVQVGTIVRIKNFGSGPARDVRLVVAAHPPTTSKLLPVDHLKPLPPGAESRGTVPQGQEITVIDVRVGGFDPDTITDIRERRANFYVYGRIEYTDQFGNGRWTAFCRRLVVQQLKTGTAGLFSACGGSDDAY